MARATSASRRSARRSRASRKRQTCRAVQRPGAVRRDLRHADADAAGGDQRAAAVPNVAIVVLTQQVNASGRLTVNGLEFNWVQPLDFAQQPLDGFGFTANFTIIDQKGEGAAPAIAIGVAPETYNATSLLRESRRERAHLDHRTPKGSQTSNLQPERHPLAPRCSATTTSSGTSRRASTSRSCSVPSPPGARS